MGVAAKAVRPEALELLLASRPLRLSDDAAQSQFEQSPILQMQKAPRRERAIHV